MTISLKHKFTSAIPDAGDPTIVQPSNWNDEHALTQATSTILGRVTAGTGVTEELTPAQTRTLLNVADGATANSSDAFLLARANHTGTQSADTLTDGTTNKAFLATERTKLTGIATGATANSTDAFLLARANHTGTQSADTLTDGTTNKAFLATERTKLAGIATGADVTATALNATAKGTPVDADRVHGSDSTASFGMVYATWTQVKAFLKTYFDTLYQPLLASLTSWGAVVRAAGFDAFAATPTSANLLALLTDETGTGAAVFANAPTISGIPVFTGIPLLTGGAISFPATQVPSAGANNLDDYEEGTWTPTLTFVTPGDLNVVYGLRNGTYTKIGRLVIASFEITTTTFTFTTASGALTISGMPFTVGAIRGFGSSRWNGITAAGYTDMCFQPNPGTTTALLAASGSGSTFTFITTGHTPSGGSMQLLATMAYEV